MSNNWLMISSYVNTYCVHCCWCWRRHIMLIVELENVKQNFCILRLQCSVNSLLLLVLAYLRKLRSFVGFVLVFSAYLLVLLPMLANLTGLAVLVLLLTSFASHCFSCVTGSVGFELLVLPSVALFFDWRWIKNNPKRLKIKMYSFLKTFLVLMKLLSQSQFYAPKSRNIKWLFCSDSEVQRRHFCETCKGTENRKHVVTELGLRNDKNRPSLTSSVVA